MGRPKKWFYSPVRQGIINCAKHKSDCVPVVKYREAVEKVLKEMETEQDGKDKVYSIKTILLEQSETYVSVGLYLYRESKTIQKYVSEFVYRVADELGYK